MKKEELIQKVIEIGVDLQIIRRVVVHAGAGEGKTSSLPTD
jgi:hypothetical protein